MKMQIILQGKTETTLEFEKRINAHVKKYERKVKDVIIDVKPCCAVDGRMYMTIQFYSILEIMERLSKPQMMKAIQTILEKHKLV